MESTMDRMMTYPGELWRSADFLNSEKNALYAVGSLIQAILGTTTCVDGLQIAATSPASMQVTIGAGVIFAQETVDATAYAGLGTDANSIMKQGLIKSPATLTITAPATSGYSQVYLVQAAYVDQDAGSAVLPYRNSANPNQPYSGPNNSGTSQYTQRNGVCNIGLKAGVAAPTGSQVAPSADAGYVPLWRITVANGATTITSANWVVDPAAPFINPKLYGIASNWTTIHHQVQVYSSPGTATFTAPVAGSYWVEVYGGGGGGAVYQPSGTSNGEGGGGGGYAGGWVTLAAGQAVTVTIGAAGANSSGGNGTAGGTSSFGAFMSATGGAGATLAGYPGQGGTGSGGQINLTGGVGIDGFVAGWQASGGDAAGPHGGKGASAGSISGDSATWPGGGGGIALGFTAGAPAAGGVIVKW